jgi:hypothetical protein
VNDKKSVAGLEYLSQSAPAQHSMGSCSPSSTTYALTLLHALANRKFLAGILMQKYHNHTFEQIFGREKGDFILAFGKVKFKFQYLKLISIKFEIILVVGVARRTSV